MYCIQRNNVIIMQGVTSEICMYCMYDMEELSV